MSNSSNIFKTADLYDIYEEKLKVSEPIFCSYGGQVSFHGPIVTVKCLEDNSLVRDQVNQPGQGQVLVVDGGGSLRCALLGDQLAQKAVDNDWAGVLIFGCIRDSVDISSMPLGVFALATNPRKSVKKGVGEFGCAVTFGGITFRPSEWLYADEDGVVVLSKRAE